MAFHSFSWLSNIPLHIGTPHLLYPSKGHLHCFHVLTIINSCNECWSLFFVQCLFPQLDHSSMTGRMCPISSPWHSELWAQHLVHGKYPLISAKWMIKKKLFNFIQSKLFQIYLAVFLICFKIFIAVYLVNSAVLASLQFSSARSLSRV